MMMMVKLVHQCTARGHFAGSWELNQKTSGTFNHGVGSSMPASSCMLVLVSSSENSCSTSQTINVLIPVLLCHSVEPEVVSLNWPKSCWSSWWESS